MRRERMTPVTDPVAESTAEGADESRERQMINVSNDASYTHEYAR
jgi:hypothetical protein